jgi:hypothetical protein
MGWQGYRSDGFHSLARWFRLLAQIGYNVSVAFFFKQEATRVVRFLLVKRSMAEHLHAVLHEGDMYFR